MEIETKDNVATTTEPFSVTGVYTTSNEEDFKVINEFYTSAHDIRIMEYMKRFFVQTKVANILPTYKDLGHEVEGVVQYQTANTLMMPKFGFDTFDDAIEAVELMKTVPKYTIIQNSPLLNA